MFQNLKRSTEILLIEFRKTRKQYLQVLEIYSWGGGGGLES